MDADGVKQPSGTLNTMSPIREVLGPECRKPFISLIWEGRDESALEISRRLCPTMSLITDRSPAGTAIWYRYTDETGEEPLTVPEAAEALGPVVEATFNSPSSEYFSRSSLSLFLFEDAAQRSSPTTSVSVAAGSGTSNIVTVNFTEDFPLGPPSAAARLFLDLVRIWQPDLASFSTISAVRARMGTGHVSHAAYLSWTSEKAHDQAPAAEGEYMVPFGEGQLFVAKSWTLAGLLALHEELGPGAVKGPEVQDPPHFPDGYPAELDRLDSEIVWGSEPNG